MKPHIPPPLVAAAATLAMWLVAGVDAAPGGLRAALALAAFVAAVAFGAPAVAAFRRARTTVDPLHVDRASTLVTSGIYARTRNPMYVAMTLAFAAWALWLGGWWAWLGPAAFVLWIDRLQIRPEEAAMEALFGDAYRAYRSRVRRWI